MIEELGAGWIRFVFEQAVESPVFLVGDFNNWDEQNIPMQHQEDGTHSVVIRLEPGDYEFKYKCGCLWHNEPMAHRYVPNCWGSENSVVVVSAADDSRSAGPGVRESSVDQRRLQPRESMPHPVR